MLKPKRLSAARFVDLLYEAQEDETAFSSFRGVTMHIVGEVEIPEPVTRLPSNVVFLGEFWALGGKLTHFNHEVHGYAVFSDLPNLKQFGPKAKFLGGINLYNCPLVTFNHRVRGDACLDSESLRSFGPKSRFEGMLDARGTSIRRFNHKVAGICEFTGVSALRTLGPNASFCRHLGLGGTGVEEFNNPVNGDVSFVVDGKPEIVPKLRKVGSKAIVRGDFIAPGAPITVFKGTVKGELKLKPNR